MANKTGSRRKYTAAQKKAYYSGMGYRAAKDGKAISFKNEKNKQSFREGYKAAGTTVSKYPDLGSRTSDSSNCGKKK